MAVLTLTVVYADDKRQSVPVTPRAQVAFEREFGTGLAKASQDMRNEYLFYLGWKSLQLCGKESSDFETFIDAIADVEIEQGTQRPDPTQSEPSSDS